MDRKQRLVFCKICENKSFDSKKGIICALTNEQATFDGTCPDFKEDAKLLKAKAYNKTVQYSSNNRYPALKTIINVLNVFGWIIGIITVIITAISIYGILVLPNFEMASLIPVIVILIQGLFLTLILIATSEFLKVIVDIEENTRNS
jgi:hypothetical protein